MNWSKLTLFLSGLFFGGAVDHVILAAIGSQHTPYGMSVGIPGNWVLAAFDLLIAGGLYQIHRRLDARLAKRTRTPNKPVD